MNVATGRVIYVFVYYFMPGC